MKKLVLALVLILGMVSLAEAIPSYCISSGLKAADGIIHTGAVDLCGVVAVTNGAADATCLVYDGISAAGTVVWKGVVAAASNFGGGVLNIPVHANIGLYLDITGAGAACLIYYFPSGP